MKQICLIITILFTSVCAKAQKEHKLFYENGNVKEVGQLDTNGKETGQWKYYHKDGKLWRIGSFENGKLSGDVIVYHENGLLYEYGNVRKGEENGRWTAFYNNGNFWKTGKFKDGKAKGKWRFFYEDRNALLN
ncbi:MAG: hypothetical protein EOO85_32660, partial [Pedobacter sp.]